MVSLMVGEGACENGICLRLYVDPAFPDRLNDDPVRARQCVSSLLSNAVKITGAGGQIGVRAETEGQADGSHPVAISIRYRHRHERGNGRQAVFTPLHDSLTALEDPTADPDEPDLERATAGLRRKPPFSDGFRRAGPRVRKR